MISAALPGAELVERGLKDLVTRGQTVESLLVSIAAPRLRTLGYSIPFAFDEPEMRLYGLLSVELGDGAHARYNSLIRRVVSFQRAAACAR